ncbi:MAG TPA: VOC family protein [Actinomycetes bacterium]|nr:VOC family protein [Actinomycetes bacterium]
MTTAGTSPLGIGQLHISVSDVDESVRWYRDVLGLSHLFTVPGQPMAFFDAGGVRLYLGEPENERFRSRPVVYYRVEDVERSFAEVAGRGAEIVSAPQVVHRDDGTELWVAFVADPDGTPVALMEERAVPPA